jgi:hypothetical protein
VIRGGVNFAIYGKQIQPPRIVTATPQLYNFRLCNYLPSTVDALMRLRRCEVHNYAKSAAGCRAGLRWRGYLGTSRSSEPNDHPEARLFAFDVRFALGERFHSHSAAMSSHTPLLCRSRCVCHVSGSPSALS